MTPMSSGKETTVENEYGKGEGNGNEGRNPSAVAAGSSIGRTEDENEITVTYKTLPITRKLASHLACEFLCHLLYSRSQIPCTISDMRVIISRLDKDKYQDEGQDWHRERRKKKRLRAGFEKNARKFLLELDALLSGIKSLFECIAPEKLTFVLGSSSGMGEEAYHLVFKYGNGTGAEISARQMVDATKKMLRVMFANSQRMCQDFIRPTKLYLLAKVCTGASEEEAALPEGFSAKPRYRLRLKKKRRRKVKNSDEQEDLSCTIISFHGPSCVVGDFKRVDVPEFFQWHKGVRGFKMSNREREKLIFS